VSDLERLLEQVRRTLKPGGIFVGVDHAFATARTEAFNLAVLPWLDDFYAWITATDPQWLYEGGIELGKQRDWGVLAIDYDPTPVPGFEPFVRELLAEMAQIVQAGLKLEKRSSGGKAGQEQPVQQESPFEDVSAERLMQALLREFRCLTFNTICPWIMPEKHIPRYRSEKERLFQHYLSAMLVDIGQHAIGLGEVDGQWFLFHLSSGMPDRQVQLEAAPAHHAEDVDDEVHLADHIEHLRAYIGQLESEIGRKNDAIADLEEQVRRREAELVEARKPRLPWKR
jgi:hypothetical protein